MVISMTIVPVMIHLAPKIGMVDIPDHRKVHSMPIPRVGGIGIVIGALIPVMLWLTFDPLITSYILGSLVLLVFGVWDDSCELGHYIKFIGQFLAVLPLVYYADLYVSVLPLIGEIPESLGKVFTVVAIVGMINAINHSDGLDGLAGGMSMLSLACIAYFMYMADDFRMLLLAISVMGGVFGFLRFNSHPAKVFMGDGGSQFLGFTLGYLAVVLTQVSNPALSPALPLLILGLPIVDILAVFYLRISGGMNWFKATRNHIHHRLLDLGFTHYESVILIYLVQMFLIICSVLMMYEYDYLILSVYLAVTVSIFTLLTVMERKGYIVNNGNRSSAIDHFITRRIKSNLVMKLLGYYIILTVPLIFMANSLLISSIPEDIGYLSIMLLSVTCLGYVFMRQKIHALLKLILYVTVAVVVYLDYQHLERSSSFVADIEIFIYVLLAIALAIVIKFDNRVDFEMSPMDYLVAIIVILALAVFYISPASIDYGAALLKLILLFYSCELIERKNYIGYNIFVSVALIALLIISVRMIII